MDMEDTRPPSPSPPPADAVELESSSSSSSSSEDDEADGASGGGLSQRYNLRSRGSSALQSILSILVGRGDFGGGVGGADTDTDDPEDDPDPSFWPPLRRIHAVEPVRPDQDMVKVRRGEKARNQC